MTAKKTTATKKPQAKKPAVKKPAVKQTETKTTNAVPSQNSQSAVQENIVTEGQATLAGFENEIPALKAQQKATGNNDDTVTILLNYYQDIDFDVEDSHGIVHHLVVKGINSCTQERSLPGQNIMLEVGSYGITKNVSRELWEAVKAKYHQMPMFQNAIIFALGSKEDERKIAEEYRGIRNGYEPVDPASLKEDFYREVN